VLSGLSFNRSKYFKQHVKLQVGYDGTWSGAREHQTNGGVAVWWNRSHSLPDLPIQEACGKREALVVVVVVV
jgi:hypothetical protein